MTTPLKAIRAKRKRKVYTEEEKEVMRKRLKEARENKKGSET